MVNFAFYLLTLMMLESLSLTSAAEVGIYAGCFLVTLAIFTGIYITLKHSHRYVIPAVIIFLALAIYSIGFPIYRLVAAI